METKNLKQGPGYCRISPRKVLCSAKYKCLLEFREPMPRRCTICYHPQHEEIAISLFRDGTRATARRFQVSLPALDRHKGHLPRTLVRAQQAQQIMDATSLLSRVEEVVNDARRITRQAEEKEELSTALAGLKTITHSLELFGKLKGELQRGAVVQVGVEVNVSSQRTETGSEVDLDVLIAQRVSEATNGFDPVEITRVKALAETVQQSSASPIRCSPQAIGSEGRI
jgi:hypothetical protein